MAFFNLTKLGVQDPIQQSLRSENKTKVNSREDSRPNRPGVEFGVHEPASKQSMDTKLAGASNISESQGSHVLYTQRLTKHQRPKLAPNEIYRKKVTSSQDHGWWIQDGAPKTLPWAHNERHSRVDSEMTRFVDEMTLTNKNFSLF